MRGLGFEPRKALPTPLPIFAEAFLKSFFSVNAFARLHGQKGSKPHGPKPCPFDRLGTPASAFLGARLYSLSASDLNNLENMKYDWLTRRVKNK